MKHFGQKRIEFEWKIHSAQHSMSRNVVNFIRKCDSDHSACPLWSIHRDNLRASTTLRSLFGLLPDVGVVRPSGNPQGTYSSGLLCEICGEQFPGSPELRNHCMYVSQHKDIFGEFNFSRSTTILVSLKSLKILNHSMNRLTSLIDGHK